MRLTAKLQKSGSHAAGQCAAVGCGSFSRMFAKTEDPQKDGRRGIVSARQRTRRVATTPKRQTLRNLESRFPYGVQSQQAILDTALRAVQAWRACAGHRCGRSFIKLYPNHENVDYAYYVISGQFHRRSGPYCRSLLRRIFFRTTRSRHVRPTSRSRRWLEKFPQSRYNADFVAHALSRECAVAKRDRMSPAIHNRGAYRAAINRAQSCITNYPNTPANEEALRIMVQAKAIGNAQLAADTERI